MSIDLEELTRKIEKDGNKKALEHNMIKEIARYLKKLGEKKNFSELLPKEKKIINYFLNTLQEIPFYNCYYKSWEKYLKDKGYRL